MGSVRANRGSPALSGLAVLESGLGAPRASTLSLDPQRLITFFSPRWSGKGRYCVVVNSRQSGRLGAYEEVPEAGDKPPVTALEAMCFAFC